MDFECSQFDKSAIAKKKVKANILKNVCNSGFRPTSTVMLNHILSKLQFVHFIVFTVLWLMIFILCGF